MRIPYEASALLGRQFIELSPDIAAAILCTLADGWEYAAASVDVNTDAGEIAITERLRDGMRSALRFRNYPWRKSMVVLPGTESRSTSCVLLPDGRTDIPMFSMEIFQRQEEHDPHAVIECKRIAGTDTHLCREYVVEGMDRFRTGKYGQNHAMGFMAGYLLADTAQDAVQGVNAYLTRASRKPEHLRPASATVTVSSWGSHHSRSDPTPPIKLHHVFFAVPSPD